MLARFGPTTPKRAGRLYDASVDPTEARKATIRSTAMSLASDQHNMTRVRLLSYQNVE
jgi:hypothetical protein